MQLDYYQQQAYETADYPNMGSNLLYPALKLNGEAGEVAEKIGKNWRNLGITNPNDLNADQKHALVLELGDVIWYVAALAKELCVSLDYVAQENLRKLRDRKERGVIKSEGDRR